MTLREMEIVGEKRRSLRWESKYSVLYKTTSTAAAQPQCPRRDLCGKKRWRSNDKATSTSSCHACQAAVKRGGTYSAHLHPAATAFHDATLIGGFDPIKLCMIVTEAILF